MHSRSQWSPSKNDHTHYIQDRKKIAINLRKMYKKILAKYATSNPSKLKDLVLLGVHIYSTAWPCLHLGSFHLHYSLHHNPESGDTCIKGFARICFHLVIARFTSWDCSQCVEIICSGLWQWWIVCQPPAPPSQLRHNVFRKGQSTSQLSNTRLCNVETYLLFAMELVVVGSCVLLLKLWNWVCCPWILHAIQEILIFCLGIKVTDTSFSTLYTWIRIFFLLPLQRETIYNCDLLEHLMDYLGQSWRLFLWKVVQQRGSM